MRTSPVGTAESSPGRQSWVAETNRISPEGTAENVPVRVLGRLLPNRGIFDLSRDSPRTGVLGHFQPSLRDSIRVVLTQALKPVRSKTAKWIGYELTSVKLSTFSGP